jgi:dihydroorotate dehydrogenase (NAD+) catalytic subunit
LPGVGEKPFSIMDNSPLTLGILERGEFTQKFNSLKKGDYFYVRGPYGAAPNISKGEDVALVGGGCGIAGLYLFAKSLSETNKIVTLLGAKDKQHLPYIKEFESFGEVHITTEDGSIGRKGLVTDLLKEAELREESYFLNCGPKAMVEAVLPLELKISSPERVYSSVDYMTRCGVGICGSCADKKGRRTCVEGPFVNP